MKKIYFGYALLYFIVLVIEFIFYISFNSTTFGLIYMITNVVVALLMLLTSINYNKKNLKLRMSKNSFLIILIVFSAFILPKFNYADESQAFLNKTRIFINIIKPILIAVFVSISILDFKFNNKGNYKIN